MFPRHYAQALFESLSEVTGSVREYRLHNFLKLLKHNGHEYRLPAITKLFEALCRREQEKKIVHIVSPAPLSEYAGKTLAIRAKLSTPHALYKYSIDETLIGGAQVLSHDHRFDTSYKTELLRLYKSLTAKV